MNETFRLNHIYNNIKYRCYNSNYKWFKNYGGRGITVCTEWMNPEKVSLGAHSHNVTKGFLAFKEWAMNNGYSDDLSIDRIDNNKGYSPDNCRWTNSKTQNNNRRNNLMITYNGKNKHLNNGVKSSS